MILNIEKNKKLLLKDKATKNKAINFLNWFAIIFLVFILLWWLEVFNFLTLSILSIYELFDAQINNKNWIPKGY